MSAKDGLCALVSHAWQQARPYWLFGHKQPPQTDWINALFGGALPCLLLGMVLNPPKPPWQNTQETFVLILYVPFNKNGRAKPKHTTNCSNIHGIALSWNTPNQSHH